MKAHVTDYSLYRWRYVIGYLFIAFVTISILGIAVFYVPGALRQGEMDAAIKSGSLSASSLTPSMVIDLPYHLLQRVGFMLFGVTNFTIKLPSVILGIGTAIGIYFLIQSWFRRNVAILVTVLAITTTQFLYLIQDGTPSIMYSFVSIWLLVAVTHITRGHIFNTFWKVVACVLMAVSFYIPLGGYLVIAMAITASFHPHIRYVLKRISRLRLVIAVVLGLASLTPLIYATIIDPKIAMTLFGIPTGAINFQQNIATVGLDLFGFFSGSNSYILRPLYSLGVFLLMMIGFYKLITVKYTARSYTVLILGVFLVPLIVLNPQHIADLYPLAVLMIAMGIATLIVNWYKFFPRNPYARIVGLVPLSIFVLGMMFSGVMRYMNNYMYNQSVLTYYNNDLRLLDRELGLLHASPDTTRLVANEKTASFYTLVAHYDKRFTVSTKYDGAPNNLIVMREPYHQTKPTDYTLAQIITSRKATESDRFYLYTKAAK